MAGSCCNRPLTTIIRVGSAQVGIVGLREIMLAASDAAAGDGATLADRLLAGVKEKGNYVTPGAEELYKDALLREYRSFVAHRGANA